MAVDKDSEPWRKHGYEAPFVIYPHMAADLKKAGMWNDDYMIEMQFLPLTGSTSK